MRDGKGETTLYIIAYDIPSDRTRTRVHKILCGFGQWTQYSLFECFLTEKEFLSLRHRLNEYLDESTDSVRFYPLCKRCARKIETVGSDKPEEPVAFFV